MKEYAKEINGQPVDMQYDDVGVEVDGVNYGADIWQHPPSVIADTIGYYPVVRSGQEADVFHVANYLWNFDGTQFVEVYSESLRSQESIVTEAQIVVDGAMASVSEMAERTRQVYAGSDPVKQSIYRKKEAEVDVYDADSSAAVQFAADRAALLGVSVSDVIDEYRSKRDFWLSIAREIEKQYDAAVIALKALPVDEAVVGAAALVTSDCERMMALLSGDVWDNGDGTQSTMDLQTFSVTTN